MLETEGVSATWWRCLLRKGAVGHQSNSAAVARERASPLASLETMSFLQLALLFLRWYGQAASSLPPAARM
eukprot:8356787-Alexandrium_andersonii.AAC.1